MEEKIWHHIIMRFPYEKYEFGIKWKHRQIVGSDVALHYLAAREVLFSLVQEFDFSLFRFHRMFVPVDRATKTTEAVNHLKLKFMCTPQQFIQVKKIYFKNLWVKSLTKKKLLKSEVEESTDSCEMVGSDHDQNWHPYMKEVWPYYIHGVSIAWMRLVNLIYKEVVLEHYFSDKVIKDPENLKDNLNLYEWVRGGVLGVWQSNAAHAFFHHTGGIFGYNFMSVRWGYYDYMLESMGFIFKGTADIYGRVRF